MKCSFEVSHLFMLPTQTAWLAMFLKNLGRTYLFSFLTFEISEIIHENLVGNNSPGKKDIIKDIYFVLVLVVSNDQNIHRHRNKSERVVAF